MTDRIHLGRPTSRDRPEANLPYRNAFFNFRISSLASSEMLFNPKDSCVKFISSRY